MPIETMLSAVCLVAFVGLVLYAAASDIATMTIPNWVSIAVVLLFPVAALLAHMTPMQIGIHVGIGVLMFLAGFALFSMGLLGGGDVKVIAAASMWTGLAALTPFAYATTIAGGVLAAIMIVARRVSKPSDSHPAYLNRLLGPENGIPYAVAIAVGALASLPTQPVVLALFT